MERLQKALATAGVASRRKCEELIAAGRVKVDGKVVTAMGVKVDANAVLEVDGKVVSRQQHLVYYMLNKPGGVVTTATDPQGRKTVLDFVPSVPRVYPVGRLDIDTQGLLLLTNDGEFTNALLHPSSEVNKIYRAWVVGTVGQRALKKLTTGIKLEEFTTAPAKVEVVSNQQRKTMLDLTLHEGRKRQVKRMLAAVGHRVLSLERIGFAFLTLDGLPQGQYRHLKAKEITQLKTLINKKVFSKRQ